MFGDGVLEQWSKQRGAFCLGDAPADHPAAENIQDHVEVEIGPLHRSHQFGDVPRPDRVGHFGQQFGFLVDGMTQLPTPFANFAMLAQQPIPRADRAMIDAVIQQRGVDLRGRLIRETWRVKQVQHLALLRTGQRTGWPRPYATDRWWRDQPDTPPVHAGTRYPSAVAPCLDRTGAQRRLLGPRPGIERRRHERHANSGLQHARRGARNP